jgi:DNA polymerase IV
MAMLPDRWIGHVDMDAFFAAAEQKDTPQWRGKPVIVGGLGPRGVVSTASYEARSLGVCSAMAMAAARRLCPGGIYVSPRFSRYRELSEGVQIVLRQFASLIEPISLDEAFFDLTDRCVGFCMAKRTAHQIKQTIQTATGLTCSVGLGPNRFLAKLASELRKPDGLLSIDPEQITEILDPLPVSQIWGVGEVTARRLESMGLLRIRDVRLTPVERLWQEFGESGRRLHQLSLGIDDTPVGSDAVHRTISRETTYGRDLEDTQEMEEEILRLSEQVAANLRDERLTSRVVRLKVRYPDFRTITRQIQIPVGTDSSRMISTLALQLLRQRIPFKDSGIRLLGVGVGGVCPSCDRQLPLFSDIV